MLGGEVLDGVDTDVQMQAAEGQDSQEMAMRTADKLLKELRPKPGEPTLMVHNRREQLSACNGP